MTWTSKTVKRKKRFIPEAKNGPPPDWRPDPPPAPPVTHCEPPCVCKGSPVAPPQEPPAQPPPQPCRVIREGSSSKRFKRPTYGRSTATTDTPSPSKPEQSLANAYKATAAFDAEAAREFRRIWWGVLTLIAIVVTVTMGFIVIRENYDIPERNAEIDTLRARAVELDNVIIGLRSAVDDYKVGVAAMRARLEATALEKDELK